MCILEGDKHEVTSLAVSSDDNTVAVGYSNGLIRVWNVSNDVCCCNTTLRYLNTLESTSKYVQINALLSVRI